MIMTPTLRRALLDQVHADAAQARIAEMMGDRGRVDNYLGLYVGQVTQHSAVCVVRQRAEGGLTFYTVASVERFAPQTPFTQIVERAKSVFFNLPDDGFRALAVDTTAVGPALEEILDLAELDYCGYVVTEGGDAATGVVNRRDLVANVQTLFQARRLCVDPDAPDVTGLLEELKTFQVKVSPDGRATFTGPTHPRTLALALAVWHAEWWKAAMRAE